MEGKVRRHQGQLAVWVTSDWAERSINLDAPSTPGRIAHREVIKIENVVKRDQRNATT
jgi:cytidylate kinase